MERAQGMLLRSWGWLLQLLIGLEPRSVEEAKKCPDWPKWKDVIEAELHQLDAMRTWEIADKPAEVNIVGSKWVFKVKKGCDREC